MRKLILIIFLTTLTRLDSYAQTTVAGGTVSGTWTKVGSPYNIMAAIQVPNDSILTIQPGCIVNFKDSAQLFVLGQILAIGNKNDTIVFTAMNTTFGWYGIKFNNTLSTNDSSMFYYCKIQNRTILNVSDPSYDFGTLYFNNFSKAIISNCSIINNMVGGGGGGIYCNNSNPIIVNNSILNNYTKFGGAGGIYCNNNSNPLIKGNYISNNNSATGVGGGIACFNSSPSIIGNFIVQNIEHNLGGGGIFCNGSNPVISNNYISNNTANIGAGGSIYCESNSNPKIFDNSISNNVAPNGGGIFCSSSNPAITNNTISNNSAKNGGALYCDFSSNPSFVNSIIWGNVATNGGPQVFINDINSTPNFNYCDIQGGSAGFDLNNNFYNGIYTNNINSNPLFVFPSNGAGTGFNGIAADWSIERDSPCINAGDPAGTYPTLDIAGNPRILEGRIDIGAYEIYGVTGVEEYNKSSLINLYPNPVYDKAVIEFSIAGKYNISLANVLGQQVINKTEFTGAKTEIDVSELPKGIYFVEVANDQFKDVKKIINQ